MDPFCLQNCAFYITAFQIQSDVPRMAYIICPWTALYLSYLLIFFLVKALIVENKSGTDENTLQCIFQ